MLRAMATAPDRHLFSIGEFSRVSGITVKALRLYHEQGLLVPTRIDAETGYRYYAAPLLDRARAIVALRRLELGLDQIGQMLASADDSAAILAAMEAHRGVLEQRIRSLRSAVRSIGQFIEDERKAIAMLHENDGVTEKSVDPMLIAGVRMKGRYGDSGKGFAKIGRAFGRLINGPCFMLHYDAEYKEDDADFEACMPVRQGKQVEGVAVRELPAAQCVCLLHKGPYDRLGPSYAKAFRYAKERGYTISVPTREVYVKGPGMIFKGNLKNYVTEIQLPIES